MTEDKALVGRLRRTYRKEFAPTGSMVATPRTVQSRLLSVDVLFNPDGAEAADRIEALTAENERLRELLDAWLGLAREHLDTELAGRTFEALERTRK